MKNIQRLYTQSTLAKKCNVSLQTVKNWCLWAGLTPPKKATYFSCDELEALADFYIAYKFLRVQQDAYIDTVLGMGGLRKYIASVRRMSLRQFVTEFLTTEEKAHFLVQILVEKLEEEIDNDEFNFGGTAA
ncbi:MAG: hypothetical protein KI793_09475 [Rivularia sp. (in: Bacteria)]|nr:hypothetical protein [Rivularia sp. MS3]